MRCNGDRYLIHKYSRTGNKKQVGFRIFLLFLGKNFKTSGANRLISRPKQLSKREVRTLYAGSIQILSKFLFASLNFCLMLPIKRYPQPQIGKKLTHLIKNAEVYTGSVIFVKTLLKNRPEYGILVKNSLALDRGEV